MDMLHSKLFRRFHTWLLLAASLIVVPTLLCCTRNSGSEEKVYSVSFPMQKMLLEAIVGENGAINTLIPPGSDPETYDPSVSSVMALSKSKAFFSLNTPGFEETLANKVDRDFGNTEIVDCSQGIEFIRDTHGHKSDPHVGNSLNNAQIVAENMYKAVVAIDKRNAGYYKKHYEALTARLVAADDSLRKILAGAPARSFVVMHPSLSYFARDYGLTQIAMEQEGKQASPRELAERMKSAKDSGARILVHDPIHSSVQAKEIARRLGLKYVEVSLSGEDWIDQLLHLARELADAPNGTNGEERRQ